MSTESNGQCLAAPDETVQVFKKGERESNLLASHETEKIPFQTWFRDRLTVTVPRRGLITGSIRERERSCESKLINKGSASVKAGSRRRRDRSHSSVSSTCSRSDESKAALELIVTRRETYRCVHVDIRVRKQIVFLLTNKMLVDFALQGIDQSAYPRYLPTYQMPHCITFCSTTQRLRERWTLRAPPG